MSRSATSPRETGSPPFHLDDVPILGANRLLAPLPVDEIGRVLQHLDHLVVGAGEIVRRPAGSLCFVLEGSARVAQLDRALGPPDHFGAREHAGGAARDTVVATTGLRVAVLTSAGFARLATSSPESAIHLAQALLRELAAELDDAGAQHPPFTSDPRVTRSPVTSSAPDDLTTPAGRDAFRRTAGLALLEAARRIGAPDVRIHASTTTGQVAVLSSGDGATWAARLDDALRSLVGEGLPVAEEVWPAERAIGFFTERGWHEAVALLTTLFRPYVALIRCGELRALSQGPVLPSTALLEGVRVHPHPQGVLLDLGDRLRTSVPRGKLSTLVLESTVPRYGAEMSRDERAWLGRLGVTSVGDFNRMCMSGGTRELIHVSEGYHEKRIAHAAEDIRARPGVRVVAIAGPSSSGKTTFIKRLKIQLQTCGLRPKELSLDDYFKDRDDTPRDSAGELDFESLDALNLDLLDRHVEALASGRAVRTARFDFRAGKSRPDAGAELQLLDGDVLLVEGLHALTPRILASIPAETAFRIFVHPAQSLPFDRLSVLEPADVRLIRRIVRDRHQRGITVAESLARWRSVRRAERLHVFPQLAEADAVFDTSLVYEPSVLRVYAERFLLEIPRAHPEAPLAHRLRRLLEPFVPLDADAVPPTSILREFIGRSGLSYD